ncbi:CopD family protein [Sphingomonas carotinifaciens]|uniref:Protoporphyrinogen IX oxidase n=1 Tax=Sphingomonas carotinifaciens TaxID=1166323 RepID=A0A1G7GY35_9SPHN|nr:CopD family protein [Sphingomonas carotinifaciens]MBB4086713.1 putative membrane protein [Sphingomonas carotinifaciens]MWC43062.1 CopD family protein [Sphingomonas carotinifaciens]SDE92984.1 putative membrane protein [Sphingomonas carotinifaciens]
MTGLLGAAYDWVKAAHLIFVIFWMAGLFMLPRYLVYHQEALAAGRTEEAALWTEREGKIRSIILTPAMLVVWLLGLLLAAHLGLFSGVPGLGWLHLKLVFVLLLTGYHGWTVAYARKLAAGRPTLQGRQLRMLNEVPALAVTLIVVLVIVKPF